METNHASKWVQVRNAINKIAELTGDDDVLGARAYEIWVTHNSDPSQCVQQATREIQAGQLERTARQASPDARKKPNIKYFPGPRNNVYSYG